jgi:hypothetical protein
MRSKYLTDYAGNPEKNGSIPYYYNNNRGQHLSKITYCPCQDNRSRTVYISSPPETWVSIPARAVFGKEYKDGYVVYDSDVGFTFVIPNEEW